MVLIPQRIYGLLGALSQLADVDLLIEVCCHTLMLLLLVGI